MSNLTLVTEGLVLSRRPYGEYDLIATLYTEALGKVRARFIGVRRPKGKLKALAEPMVHGEYRLYARPGSEWVTATGGRIVDSFPGIRADLERTFLGLRLCELLDRVAADRAPNPAKLALALSFLGAVQGAGSPWLAPAFGLRLLDSAGFGLLRSRPEGVGPGLWAALHEEPLEALERRADDEPARRRAEARLERAFEELVERPLATSRFAESMRKAGQAHGAPA